MVFILTLRNEIPKNNPKPYAPTAPNLSFAPLHYALVPLHFAPVFCPFFFICFFTQINHILQHIHIKKSCTLIFLLLIQANEA